MRNVASRSSQHSKMLGQPASSHTVCRPSRRTSSFKPVYDGPVRSRVLIHDGFRSIAVSELRASMRNKRRPSASTDKRCLQHFAELLLGDVKHVPDANAVTELARQRSDTG